jgi:hypothetical protein
MRSPSKFSLRIAATSSSLLSNISRNSTRRLTPFYHSRPPRNRFMHYAKHVCTTCLYQLQMLQPKYTMHGFNWFDRRGTEGVGFIRALRTLLTSNLPQILPDLGIIIKSRFCELHSGHLVINGKLKTLLSCSPLTPRLGKRRSPVYGTITKLVILANSVSFFGKELGKKI